MKAFATLSAALVGLAAIPGSQAADLPTFRHVTIDAYIKIGYGIAIADMNADKKPDIVLCDDRNIAWYENPSWKKHIIVENLTPRDHVCIAVRDIDGGDRRRRAMEPRRNQRHRQIRRRILSHPARRPDAKMDSGSTRARADHPPHALV
jgi:hypothetical protein